MYPKYEHVEETLFESGSKLDAYFRLKDSGNLAVLLGGFVFFLHCDTMPSKHSEYYWGVSVDGPLVLRRYTYDGYAKSAECAARDMFATLSKVHREIKGTWYRVTV